MKKIYTARRDDIIRQRDEWNAREAQHEEQYNKYYQAKQDVLDSVEKNILDQLSKYDKLDFQVRVYNYNNYSRGVEDQGQSVRISCNERTHKVLAWSFQLDLYPDGTIRKETGSWSGLEATTDEDLEVLDQTVGALKTLNHMDWASVLNFGDRLPDKSNYVTEKLGAKPNFDAMIKEADIQDAIDEGAWMRFKNLGEVGTGWLQIVGETPKQYRFVVAYNEDQINREDHGYVYRMKKETVLDHIVYPLETV